MLGLRARLPVGKSDLGRRAPIGRLTAAARNATTSQHIHQQPVILRVQIWGNFFRNPRNIFRFRRIVSIFNSLPGQYPFWVVRYPQWVLRNGNRIVEHRYVLALPTPCLRRYNSASWPSYLDTMSEVSMQMS